MSDTKTFFDAIRSGDLPQVRSLLDADPSLASARNESGVSALLTSIYTGRREIRELLLSSGATMGLHEAAAAGNLERVKHFVDPNPSLAKSFSPDGFPVFALACFFGHLDTARYLYEQGADIHAIASNGTGYNALTAAVTAGHTEIVRWLLERGLDPNYRYGPGYTPLLAAAANGHLDIVKLLLSHGADPHATSNDGKSALAVATERNHAHVSDFLRTRSASAG
ncbi:MAG TPA: ankyrin repeat domain-containing protein [Candidatus Sulfotelmatobacter sp.]|nr:ankyrin repeat domain-containing protein [Candidatus Sulfotelmatobacter sp.]